MSLKQQRIHVLQHVPFEGPAAIEKWVFEKGHVLSVTKLYQGEPPPSLKDFDWLIVMGGPMGVDEIERYPWLVPERRLILEAVKSGKYVLGICLGAQLIAAALGAIVKKSEQREIGWFKVRRAQHLTNTILSEVWPESIKVFHWHGETFDIPQGAILLASSDACINQGFILDNRVVGLQFHLEMTADSVTSLIDNCHNELDGSKYVQSAAELMAAEHLFFENNQLLYRLLERLGKNFA